MFRAADKWLIPWIIRRLNRKTPSKMRHVMLCVCDHFEPFHRSDHAGAVQRMEMWQQGFCKLTERFSDADGGPPKQTFFYPIEQYDEDIVTRLAKLCRATGSEVEVHLHHHDDTAEGVEQALTEGKENYRQHGFLANDPEGRCRFGFVHGNWALDNSDPRGINCGVDRELEVLRAAGCYADFTMPSAPHPTQTKIINSIYYATETAAAKSHDTGVQSEVGVTAKMRDDLQRLLLVQGPLTPNFKRRKWQVVPRLENAELSGVNPPDFERFALWLEENISVRQREDWVFIKLHTHGGIERNMPAFLGDPAYNFHQALADSLPEGVQLHYVTAREAVNIIHAAEDGQSGSPGDYRDYYFSRPEIKADYQP